MAARLTTPSTGWRHCVDSAQSHFSFRHCCHLSSGMLQPVRHDATCQRQNFPRRFRVSSPTKIQSPPGPPLGFGSSSASLLSGLQFHPCDTSNSKGETLCDNSLNSSPPPVAGSAVSAR
ncbi:MAG: hypothetical protein E5W97_30090 [Mesorhizobium sp.]|nr:MAG: hypothetical protein E5W97_30090 [Mesorhizobium sp.]